jgi:uncharacterized protein (DUF2252 family)
MARSAHAYVRGSTALFYDWLQHDRSVAVPEGPSIWIGGDCHVGNLGPLADHTGDVRVQIRDLDQTTIGNPAHDLIRLALSLSSLARGSNLKGVTTARILEGMMDGYVGAFDRDFDEEEDHPKPPEAIRTIVKRAQKRTWKHLAMDRIEGVRPTLPLGRKFWPISPSEREAIATLGQDGSITGLARKLTSREDDAGIEIVDVAYWVKGCSSLGNLRYAVLLSIEDSSSDGAELCLMDFKEAGASLAPSSDPTQLPPDDAERIVEGAAHISPHLGDRMRAVTLEGRPVFVRELMPQDLKIDIPQVSDKEATLAAAFLASVVGFAHARQMDTSSRKEWSANLIDSRSHDLDAPPWLWQATVQLLMQHERSYLEHCRRFALDSSHD